ncbi:MAG: hypothetical protein LBP93_05595 [Treponema sp.]|jgi:hypothetical protein|nr:hypothetical protein [Treponema sp.]
MIKIKRYIGLVLLLSCTGMAVYGQTSSTVANSISNLPATQFDTSDFPLWAKDLRRAEIVAFGSFPFTVFFASLGMDLYRSAAHDWDRRYAPWPLKTAGSIDMTTDQHFITLGIAAAGSVLISLADYLIVRYKRNKAERQAQQIPAGDPIIIRRPWPEEEEPPQPEAPAEEDEVRAGGS